jgi:Protein of unknown function (DUF3152)
MRPVVASRRVASRCMHGSRLRLALFAAVTVLVVAALALRDQDDSSGSGAAAQPTPSPSSPSSAAAPTEPPAGVTSNPTAPSTPPTSTAGLPDPGNGGGVEPTGTFTGAPGGSFVAGTGPLIVYAVQVENGVPIAPQDFAAEVDRILADPRGWTADGSRSLQRVEDPALAAFRVVLATPATTDELCAPLRTNGIFSCFNHGVSVINLDRWNLGAEAQSGLPLPEYRNYVVSHEVGHALGFGHVACPAPGWPAPVMMQQTKGIDGCAPNPWPFP